MKCMKLSNSSEQKIKEILSLEKISKQDLDKLNEQERVRFNAILNEKINSLKGAAKDEFLEQIDNITDNSTKNQFWEFHHAQITWAVSALMQDTGRMPTINEIVSKTEISRATVLNHLKEYSKHTFFQKQADQFKFMVPKVMASMFKFAVNGNVAAAKLYLEATGETNLNPNKGILIQNQTNYIQINGITLSPELVQALNSDQLKSIEMILKTAQIQT